MISLKNLIILSSGWIQSGVGWSHDQDVLYNPTIVLPTRYPTTSSMSSYSNRKFEKRSVDVEVLVKAIGSWVPVNQLVCINPILLTLGPYICFGATAVSAMSGLTLMFRSFTTSGLWKMSGSGIITTTTTTMTEKTESTAVVTRTVYSNNTLLIKRQQEEDVVYSKLSSAITRHYGIWDDYCGDGGVLGSGHVLCEKHQDDDDEEEEQDIEIQVWNEVIPMVEEFINVTESGDAFVDALFEYNDESRVGKFGIQSLVFGDRDGRDDDDVPWMIASGINMMKNDNYNENENFDQEEVFNDDELLQEISNTLIHDSEYGVELEFINNGGDGFKAAQHDDDDVVKMMAKIEFI